MSSTAGREDTGKDAVAWAIQAAKLGAGEILLTSMDCDGQKTGYDLELTRAVSCRVNIPVIASGGAGTMSIFPMRLNWVRQMQYWPLLYSILVKSPFQN